MLSSRYMQQSFQEAIDRIMRRHGEYAPDAYHFIRHALDFASRTLNKTAENPHLTAEELYMGSCAYATSEYGPLAAQVWEFWGINSSSDIGNIVYNLIEAGVFGKQKGDSREQFDGLPSPEFILNTPFCPCMEDILDTIDLMEKAFQEEEDDEEA